MRNLSEIVNMLDISTDSFLKFAGIFQGPPKLYEAVKAVKEFWKAIEPELMENGQSNFKFKKIAEETQKIETEEERLRKLKWQKLQERDKKLLLIKKELESNLGPYDKIFVSPKLFTEFQGVSQEIKETRPEFISYFEKKPQGLWYSCGTEWLNPDKFVLHPTQRTLTQPNLYIYKITVNPDKLLKIKTFEELKAFNEK